MSGSCHLCFVLDRSPYKRDLQSTKKTIFSVGLVDLERGFAAWSSVVDSALKFDVIFFFWKSSGCQSAIKVLNRDSCSPILHYS